MSTFDALRFERNAHRKATEELGKAIKKICPHPALRPMNDDQIVADWECLECQTWLSSSKLDMTKYRPVGRLRRLEDVYYAMPAL